MQYFAHTRKACGPIALALVLSACGDQASNSFAISENLTIPGSQVTNPGTFDAILAQNPPTSEVSSPAPGGADPIRSTDSSTVITSPVSNQQPGNDTPISGRPGDPGGDTLPVEPPTAVAIDDDAAAPNPSIGGDPYVSLIARTDNGLNTSGTRLVWEAENVDACEASGAWEGSLNNQGELQLEHSEAGDLTYMISCRGANGTAMAMVTVSVESTALAWEPPQRNTNGTELTDLAGYNLYYGTEPGSYSNIKPVRDASLTALDLPVEPGTYYLAMTAYDLSGNESELSNEIVRIVN